MPKSQSITRSKISESPVQQTLYLVRHAIAAERGPDWPDDTVRPVTSKGAARMRQAARGLRELDVEVTLVLASPLLRARQTAEIVADGLKSTPKVEVLAALAPGGVPVAVMEGLAQYPKARALALVGHEPDLGQLVAWLLGGHSPAEFKKGGVCRIDVEGEAARGTGRLVWMATPAMLRALGERR